MDQRNGPTGSHPRMLDRTFTVRYTPVDLEPGTIGGHIERTGCAARPPGGRARFHKAGAWGSQ
ncbi:hypothetical protein P0D88_34065 [Paraburkholderia sp. RL18-103-BIB-C]|jgi:hypothetical protein|uniref:hypothetical protein n=1 Tax=unclassified Paraburkholderia TaxID=2615204 RepID=UPI0038BDE375